MRFYSKHPQWPGNVLAADATQAANRLTEEFRKQAEDSHVTFYHPNKKEYVDKYTNKLRQDYLDQLQMLAPYPQIVIKKTWEVVCNAKGQPECYEALKKEVPELTKAQRTRIADCLSVLGDPEMLYYCMGAKETGLTEKEFVLCCLR